MPNWARPFISGFVGAILAGFAGWLATKGIDINEDTRKQVVEYLVEVVLPIAFASFHIGHKVTAKYVNPGDAATSQLAEEHVHENEQLKAAGSNSPSVIQ